MPKVASNKQAKAPKADKENKEKRAPTAYQLFFKEKLPVWKAANPGKAQSLAMKEIAVEWRDAPENVNRGKEPKAKKPKPSKNAEPSSSRTEDE